MRCKDLATIFLGQKIVAGPCVRWKQVSWVLKCNSNCYILALAPICLGPTCFGPHAYLFSLDEGSCYNFLTRNNCYKFLASYGVILQSDIQPYFKIPVCGAPFSYKVDIIFASLKSTFKILHWTTTKEKWKSNFALDEVSVYHNILLKIYRSHIKKKFKYNVTATYGIFTTGNAYI